MRRWIALSSAIFAAPFSRASATETIVTHTLRPQSGEVVDCHGGTLRAAAAASVDPGTGETIPSSPEVLIYLKDVRGVKIQDCVLEDADFGIYVVRGGNHKIAGNTIDAGTEAITMLASSRNRITANHITFGGDGIRVEGNSDANRITGNDLRFVPRPVGAHRPGSILVERYPFPAGAGVAAFTDPIPEFAVINVIVDGELTQVPADTELLEDHLVEDNTIDVTGASIGVGIMTRTQRGTSRNNRIQGGFYGFASFGFPDFFDVTLPGYCTLDAGRRCRPDSLGYQDCQIPGHDAESKGVCVGVTSVDSEVRVVEPLHEGNTVSGAFIGAGVYLTRDARIVENDISGGVEGIEIGDYTLEASRVEGNIVRGNAVGLFIWNELGQYAGATVSFNDFIDNQLSVDAIQAVYDPETNEYRFVPYTLETTFAYNHWGLTCEQGGFPANPAVPITDEHPYGAPIAAAYREGDLRDPGQTACH